MKFFKSVLALSIVFSISLCAQAQSSGNSMTLKNNFKNLQESVSAAQKLVQK